MKVLAPKFQSWRLIILGEGPLRAELEKLRDSLGLGDQVELIGRVPDPWPWLNKSQIFLMSSRSEGFPNALCEAMVAGLPVVSTDCPSGPADIITPEEDGILVATEDPEAIAEGLARLMNSPDLREKLSAAAPKIGQKYSPETVFSTWDKLIVDILGSPSN